MRDDSFVDLAGYGMGDNGKSRGRPAGERPGGEFRGNGPTQARPSARGD